MSMKVSAREKGGLVSQRQVVKILTLYSSLKNPLSTAVLRYSLHTKAISDGPGSHDVRPFGLRFSATFPTPAPRPMVRYCHELQVAVDESGRPLIEQCDNVRTQAKKWNSKDTTDGDEGPEESVWEWEE